MVSKAALIPCSANTIYTAILWRTMKSKFKQQSGIIFELCPTNSDFNKIVTRNNNSSIYFLNPMFQDFRNPKKYNSIGEGNLM